MMPQWPPRKRPFPLAGFNLTTKNDAVGTDTGIADMAVREAETARIVDTLRARIAFAGIKKSAVPLENRG